MNTFIKEALLTRSGNLFIEPTGKYEGYSLFTTANGEFLRFVEEEDEANYLRNLDMGKVTFSTPLKVILPVTPRKKYDWRWLCKFTSHEDNSCYRWETSANGGDYSYWTDTHVFYNSKRNTFIMVDFCQTSGEFSYSDDGYFTNEMCHISASNVFGFKGWKDWQREEGVEVAFLKSFSGWSEDEYKPLESWNPEMTANEVIQYFNKTHIWNSTPDENTGEIDYEVHIEMPEEVRKCILMAKINTKKAWRNRPRRERK